MNALLDPVKRIARDLVDKKLWPVAALLVAAIVAVPMLIGSSSGEAPAPAPAPATAPAQQVKSLVTVAEPGVTGPASRAGRISDPFYDPPAPAEQTVAPAGSAAAPASNGAPASAKGAAGSAKPAPKVAQPPAPAAPSQPGSPTAKGTYQRTTVQWYQAQPGTPRPIARLTALGGAAEPAALFLGVTKAKGTYAMFLLAPGVTPEGEGTCENETSCRIIGLKAGETQVVTLPSSGDGGPRRHELKVTSVKTIETDAATARTMRARVHADGRKVMRAMWQDRPTAEALGPIRYDVASGLLFKVPTAAKQAAG